MRRLQAKFARHLRDVGRAYPAAQFPGWCLPSITRPGTAGILDDIFGWSNDGRLQQMVRVLDVAAREMGVSVLTCQAARFARFVAAPQFQMEALKRKGDAAG